MIKSNIYIICNLISRGQNRGVTFPSPFNNTILSALHFWTKMLYWHYLSALKTWTKWMCQSHGILQLPCSLFRTTVLPLHLYLSNGTIWNFSKSLLACISTHHRIFFLVLENSSPQLGTFPVSLATNNSYDQAPSNESIPMSVLTRFSKIIDESHAHVYWHKINKSLSSEPNTHLHK